MKRLSIGLDVALEQQGHEVRRHQSDENEIKICCMFCEQRGHGPDRKFRLGINIATGQAHCFKCGWKTGDIYRLIAKATGQRVSQPYKRKPQANEEVDPELPEGFQLIWTGDKQLDTGIIRRRAVDYLLRRGVTRDQARRHKIGFCGTGRYAFRVVFPVYDGKKLLTFIGRDFTGKAEPRFLNLRGAKPLYNLEALHRVEGTCLVVLYEGVFKVLAGELAYPTAVHMATLGSSISDMQLASLSKAVAEVVLFPDPNKAGLDGFLKVGHALQAKQFQRLSVAWPLPSREADEYDPCDVALRIENRVPFYRVAMKMAMRIENTLDAVERTS